MKAQSLVVVASMAVAPSVLFNTLSPAQAPKEDLGVGRYTMLAVAKSNNVGKIVVYDTKTGQC